MTLASELLSSFKDRGFWYQCTDEDALDKRLSTSSMPVYIGFDCTAPSLHVGSLVQIMTLRALQQFGFKPIVLLGSGTTRVGDPSGKDTSRTLLDEASIERNKQGIFQLFERFLTFGDGESDALLVDNADWLLSLNYIELLRDIGKHFTINRMLGFESVKQRLEREHPLTFLEFNYMILQAYDFVELNRRYGCCLQIGGSDQWGNIVNGIELARRVGVKDELFGLTTPLITTSSGAKMGKTAQGAVWLTEKETSVYDYWQFWRNTEDADVGRFLRLFTELPIEEITRLEALEGAEINQAKIVLANEATALCHGIEASQKAEKTARETFESGAYGDDLPMIEVSKTILEKSLLLTEALLNTGLAESKGAAKRLIRGGGVKVNDLKINDEAAIIALQDANDDGMIKLSCGKKRHALIKVA